MPSTTNPSTTSSRIEYRAADSLRSAILLALTGGSLDAFVYLNHGHVFAAAMTGNGVLLGVAFLHHDYLHAAHHLVAILGFVLGIFLANVLDSKLKHHAVLTGLLGEISVLLTASFLPGSFPDFVFVPLIAIVAAYQVTSFRRADTYAYNSTFITGNLRSAVDGLYDALDPAHRKAGLRKFRDLSAIILAFLAGAVAGAILSPKFLNHTLWFICLPLVTVLITVLIRDESSPSQPDKSATLSN
ncbi:MAG: YoaK family protein [Acidobacteriaceae bacterium]